MEEAYLKRTLLKMLNVKTLEKKIIRALPTKSFQIRESRQPLRLRITVLAGTSHSAPGAASAWRHAEWENHTRHARSNVPCVFLPLIIYSLARMGYPSGDRI